jgi:hypothetical protein
VAVCALGRSSGKLKSKATITSNDLIDRILFSIPKDSTPPR